MPVFRAPLQAAYPGRFLLGIGVGHAEMISEYRKPCRNALVEYLDRLDDYGVPANRRVVAAHRAPGLWACPYAAAPGRTRT